MHKKAKIFSKKFTAIIVGVIIFSLILPQIAKANLFTDFTGMFIEKFTPVGIAKAILAMTLQFVFSLLNWLVHAAAGFFNGMLNIGFTSHLDIVKAGWEVTRDFSNMFFILFMVIVAFATILRIQRYGIKELLPKVIGVALLINFSYVICAVVIDFSNIAANFFINDIKKYTSDNAAGTFTTSLRLIEVYTPLNCDELSNVIPKAPPDYSGPPLVSDKEQCVQQLTAGSQATQIGADFFTFLISMTVGSLVFLIAALVLFIGGIMLLIRIVFIWFLVMIVPLVFLCYIMPALRGQWRKWWSTFLSWCFFAPLFAFFIWLAMKVSIEGKTKEVARLNAPEFTGVNAFSNIFTSAPATALIHYLFIIALLVGALIAAKQLGIHGANTALAIGQKWGKGATDWAKRTSLRPVKYAASQLGGAATSTVGKMFGATKFGRRLEARGYQMKMKAAEERQHKQYAALVSVMSKEDVYKEIQTATGVRKIIATREAQKRGILREADRDTIRKAAGAMQAYGARDVASQLEELRPDAIENEDKRKEAIERATKEGTHKKWSKEVFEGVEGTEIAEELKRQLGVGEFINVFKTWGADVKEAAETALRGNFTDDFKDKDNIKRRKDYATISGKMDKAFLGDRMGALHKDYRIDPTTRTTRPEWEKAIQEHTQSMRDDDFGRLKTNADKMLAAQYMKSAQVAGAGTKLSGTDKELMKKVAAKLNKDPNVIIRMNTYDTWR